MKRGTLLLIIPCLVCLVQLAVPLGTVWTQEQVLSQGELMRFRAAPIDPYDPFRGRYVRLSLLPREVEAEVDFEPSRRDRIWVELRGGADGFAEAVAVHRTRPRGVLALPATVRSVRTMEERDGSKVPLVRPIVRFSLGLERYYLPEHLALPAELAARRVRSRADEDEVKVWVEVRILDGHGQIQELYLDGLPLREYLRREAEAEAEASKSGSR